MAQKDNKKGNEEELTMEGYVLHLYNEVYFGIRSPQDAENLLREQVNGLSAPEQEAFRKEARQKGLRMMQVSEAFLSSLTLIGAGQ